MISDSKPLFEREIEETLRLSWPTICKLAVKARCMNVSIDRVVEIALREKIAEVLKERKRK